MTFPKRPSRSVQRVDLLWNFRPSCSAALTWPHCPDLAAAYYGWHASPSVVLPQCAYQRGCTQVRTPHRPQANARQSSTCLLLWRLPAQLYHLVSGLRATDHGPAGCTAVTALPALVSLDHTHASSASLSADLDYMGALAYFWQGSSSN